MEQKLQGITLRAIDFKERQRIVTLLTPNFGLISVMVYGIGGKKFSLMNLTTPLTFAEWVLRPGRGEIWKYLDASILHIPLGIRQNLQKLQAAQKILTHLLTTQLPHKPSPELYALAQAFLKRIEISPQPATLALAFHLKFLRHEGLLPLDRSDSHWQGLTDTHWNQIVTLTTSRSFDAIEKTPVDRAIERFID